MAQNIGEDYVNIPQDYNLVAKPNVAPAVSKRLVVLPQNGAVFNPGETITYEIPTGRQAEYLSGEQTYLALKIKNTSASASTSWVVDSTGFAFIKKLEILSNGAQIEIIDNYGHLLNTLYTAQSSHMDHCTVNTICLGSDPNWDDVDISATAAGQTVAKDGSITVMLPILSGILGAQCHKMLPLNLLHSLTLNLTLAPAVEPVVTVGTGGTAVAAGAPNWEVSSTSLVLQVVQLDSEVDKMLQAQRGDAPVEISCETWRSYNSTIANQSTSANVLIPAKFSSIKNILTTFRRNTDLVSANFSSTSGRVNPFASAGASVPSVQYQVNNTLIPANPLDNVPAIFVESMKAFHNWGNIHAKCKANNLTYDSSLNTYGTATALDGTNNTVANVSTYYGKLSTFFMAYGFDNFYGESQKSHNGISSMNGNLFLNMTFSSALAQQTRMDSFVNIDQVLVIDPVSKAISIRT